jgi:hypothetical protein
VVSAVLATLHDLVPDDAGYVADVVPVDVRHLWAPASSPVAATS